MSRKASTNGRTDRGASPRSPVDNSPLARRGDTPASPHRPDSPTDLCGPALARLVDRSDGWLRIVPDTDTGQVYIKWKYSRGYWRGHYLMAVVQYWQMGYGLNLLLDKLQAVEEHASKPSLDTPYNS